MTLKPYILTAILFISSIALQAQDFGNIEFVENKGQWDSKVRFKGDVSAGAFFIRNGGFTVMQNNQDDLHRVYEYLHKHKPEQTNTSARSTEGIVLRGHAYNVDFLDASPDMEIVPDKLIPTYNNYFIGNDPSKWAGNCKIYQGITLENVYPNVNVRYYTDKGTLKYDLIVKPGADISKIALKYEGMDKLEVKNKELVVKTSVGDLRESSPYTYQYDKSGKKEISCKYVIHDNIVRFDIKGYDPNSTLIIDPTLIFCSFAGSQANNWGFTATYGPDGSMFGGGIVFSNGFPVNAGAYQINFQGGNATPPSDGPIDIGLIKLSPDGSNRVYATYLGGGGNEVPSSLIVDPQGDLIVAGRTNSGNYPTTPANTVIGNGGSWDIFVTKFNATGSALIGSKRIGGSGLDGCNITEGSDGVNSLNRNYGDEIRSEVNLDAAGNIYVASCTQSHDFPTTSAFQTSFGGGLQDGVVLKFNSTLSALLFSTYLGGDGNDAAYVLDIAPSGDIYVAGGTESSTNSFPGNHAGTVGASYNGNVDGFVAQINSNGSSIIRSTFLGTSAPDQVYGLKFDKKGFPYVMGQTE